MSFNCITKSRGDNFVFPSRTCSAESIALVCLIRPLKILTNAAVAWCGDMRVHHKIALTCYTNEDSFEFMILDLYRGFDLQITN